MIEPDIVTSCAVAELKAWGIEARKKAKRIDCAMEIVSKDDYRFAKFGKIPGNSPRILWREDGSMFTSKGILYLPVHASYHRLCTRTAIMMQATCGGTSKGCV